MLERINRYMMIIGGIMIALAFLAAIGWRVADATHSLVYKTTESMYTEQTDSLFTIFAVSGATYGSILLVISTVVWLIIADSPHIKERKN